MTALRNWWVAVESGWRAGLKQYRKRRTELAQRDDMTIIERTSELPHALAYTYRSWRRFWWLARGHRNPDDCQF